MVLWRLSRNCQVASGRCADATGSVERLSRLPSERVNQLILAVGFLSTGNRVIHNCGTAGSGEVSWSGWRSAFAFVYLRGRRGTDVDALTCFGIPPPHLQRGADSHVTFVNIYTRSP